MMLRMKLVACGAVDSFDIIVLVKAARYKRGTSELQARCKQGTSKVQASGFETISIFAWFLRICGGVTKLLDRNNNAKCSRDGQFQAKRSETTRQMASLPKLGECRLPPSRLIDARQRNHRGDKKHASDEHGQPMVAAGHPRYGAVGNGACDCG